MHFDRKSDEYYAEKDKQRNDAMNAAMMGCKLLSRIETEEYCKDLECEIENNKNKHSKNSDVFCTQDKVINKLKDILKAKGRFKNILENQDGLEIEICKYLYEFDHDEFIRTFGVYIYNLAIQSKHEIINELLNGKILNKQLANKSYVSERIDIWLSFFSNVNSETYFHAYLMEVGKANLALEQVFVLSNFNNIIDYRDILSIISVCNEDQEKTLCLFYVQYVKEMVATQRYKRAIRGSEEFYKLIINGRLPRHKLYVNNALIAITHHIIYTAKVDLILSWFKRINFQKLDASIDFQGSILLTNTFLRYTTFSWNSNAKLQNIKDYIKFEKIIAAQEFERGMQAIKKDSLNKPEILDLICPYVQYTEEDYVDSQNPKTRINFSGTLWLLKNLIHNDNSFRNKIIKQLQDILQEMSNHVETHLPSEYQKIIQNKMTEENSNDTPLGIMLINMLRFIVELHNSIKKSSEGYFSIFKTREEQILIHKFNSFINSMLLLLPPVGCCKTQHTNENIILESIIPNDILNLLKNIHIDYLLANLHFKKAVELHEVGKKFQAFYEYRETIELNPYHAEAYFHRARILELKPKKINMAIADYTTVIELTPDNAAAYYRRANIYVIQEKFSQALKDYSKALELKLDDVEVVNKINLMLYSVCVEQLNQMYATDVYMIIFKLPEIFQVPLLKACLNQRTELGKYFSDKNTILTVITDQLIKLNPDFDSSRNAPITLGSNHSVIFQPWSKNNKELDNQMELQNVAKSNY